MYGNLIDHYHYLYSSSSSSTGKWRRKKKWKIYYKSSHNYGHKLLLTRQADLITPRWANETRETLCRVQLSLTSDQGERKKLITSSSFCNDPSNNTCICTCTSSSTYIITAFKIYMLDLFVFSFLENDSNKNNSLLQSQYYNSLTMLALSKWII